MRLAYGVHGYGRGHATRALAVLPELARRHEVLVLAGDDAWRALRDDYRVVRIPVLRYALDKSGRRSPVGTIRRAVPSVLDLKLGGRGLGHVADTLRRFDPHVVVSDSEAWTHHAAHRLRLPRISFDHFAVLVECDWPMSRSERLACALESLAYRGLMGRPQRCVVASFYAPPPRRRGVRVVGPVLREAVRRARPRRGDHLLVYLSNGDHHYTPRVASALSSAGCPVYVYGTSRTGRRDGVQFKPLSNEQFVLDLAGCRGIFSTAGNQLISEAVHLGKPMLIMPEDALEQRLNAQTVERLGYGTWVRRGGLTAEALARFLADEDRYVSALRGKQRDGAREAVEAIDRFARELAGRN